jgi:hypothetical protein
VKSTFKPTDGAARGLTFCTNSWSLSTPPQNASSPKVSRRKDHRQLHRLIVCKICREVLRRARQSEPGADPGRTVVRAPAVGTPARCGRPDGYRRERIGPPRAKAGDAIKLRVEMDLIVGLTACSTEMSNNDRFKPIEYEILPRRRAEAERSRIIPAAVASARISWRRGRDHIGVR